jgi:hypothetical protein
MLALYRLYAFCGITYMGNLLDQNEEISNPVNPQKQHFLTQMGTIFRFMARQRPFFLCMSTISLLKT